MLYFLIPKGNLNNKSVLQECDNTDKGRNHSMNIKGKTEIEKVKWK